MMSNKNLGSMGARLLTALVEENRQVFSIADAQRYLSAYADKPYSYAAANELLRRLGRAGWVVRLSAGRYALVPLTSGNTLTPQLNRYVIAREVLGNAPYYISHESAMEIHNLLTHPVGQVLVTTPRRLASREILGIPYRFIYAPPVGIWGHELRWVTPYEQVMVSDLERTLLDGLMRTDLCAGIGQVATALWMRHDELDGEKLADYAERAHHRAAAQRLGYLLELYGLGTPDLAARLLGLRGTAYALLDPLLPDEGPYLSRWRLRINIEPETLQSSIRT